MDIADVLEHVLRGPFATGSAVGAADGDADGDALAGADTGGAAATAGGAGGADEHAAASPTSNASKVRERSIGEEEEEWRTRFSYSSRERDARRLQE